MTACRRYACSAPSRRGSKLSILLTTTSRGKTVVVDHGDFYVSFSMLIVR
jgi:hypothetical protein